MVRPAKGCIERTVWGEHSLRLRAGQACLPPLKLILVGLGLDLRLAVRPWRFVEDWQGKIKVKGGGQADPEDEGSVRPTFQSYFNAARFSARSRVWSSAARACSYSCCEMPPCLCSTSS